jgi:murein peptide amidase A
MMRGAGGGTGGAAGKLAAALATAAFAAGLIDGDGSPFAEAAESEPITIGESVRGRAITATQIGDPAAERVVLVVGVIHGDERAGLQVIERLRQDHAEIQGVQIWLVPTVNPDGLEAGTRGNAHRVDLNRNFPYRWRGGVSRSSGYYPGPRPRSEPETRAAMAFIGRIQPDLSIWYHQPWGAVLACRGKPRLAALYAKLALMRTSCRGRGLSGTAINWQNHRRPGAPAFVVEFRRGGIDAITADRHARAAAALAGGGG